MSHNAEDAISELHRQGCSCVILSRGEIKVCRQRGVKDLLDILDSDPGLLHGAFIADKVVGKGAAALMVLGGVAGVYAGVISRPAIQMLEDADISVEYHSLTDNIINRSGTGLCPVETLCLPCATPQDCLPLIKAFISSLKPESNTVSRTL